MTAQDLLKVLKDNNLDDNDIKTLLGECLELVQGGEAGTNPEEDEAKEKALASKLLGVAV